MIKNYKRHQKKELHLKNPDPVWSRSLKKTGNLPVQCINYSQKKQPEIETNNTDMAAH